MYNLPVQPVNEQLVNARKKYLSWFDHADEQSPKIESSVNMAFSFGSWSIRNSINFQGSAMFDFSETGPEVYGNCNAPKAVSLSAVIYCLRCMVGHDIPLNQVSLNSVYYWFIFLLHVLSGWAYRVYTISSV